MTVGPKEYRSKARIYTDMLSQIVKEGGGSGPTRILYGANLSHDRLMRHLSQLISLGLVEEDRQDEKSVYRITEKGLGFLREFAKTQEFANAFGIEI